MPVTTANTIRFSDVCLEIYGSSSTAGRTLLTAHNDARPVGFTTNFDTQGSLKTLLDFRGYSHAFTIDPFDPNNPINPDPGGGGPGLEDPIDPWDPGFGGPRGGRR